MYQMLIKMRIRLWISRPRIPLILVPIFLLFRRDHLTKPVAARLWLDEEWIEFSKNSTIDEACDYIAAFAHCLRFDGLLTDDDASRFSSCVDRILPHDYVRAIIDWEIRQRRRLRTTFSPEAIILLIKYYNYDKQTRKY